MALFQACPDQKLSLSRSETVQIRVVHCNSFETNCVFPQQYKVDPQNSVTKKKPTGEKTHYLKSQLFLQEATKLCSFQTSFVIMHPLKKGSAETWPIGNMSGAFVFRNEIRYDWKIISI